MIRHLVVALGLAAALLLPVEAQVRPVYDMGAAGLLQLLQRLQNTASVLHTGAHPDDEDSAFLARAARGDHARVAYLSLTRGEGGQNLIGPELFDALGVIRTEELLEARRLDGAEQYFGRAFDFGFSKRREEAAAKWNEREMLDDMVRVIRQFRPLVVSARWGGTGADGHGHHQMAGYLTPLAFKAAADPNEFPEQLREGLRPWQARKLYSRPLPDAPGTLNVQTGVFDPALGRTYAEIAFEGRSQHKSQGQGTTEILGPLASSLRVVTVAAASTPDRSLFAGLDATVLGLARLAGLPEGALRGELATVSAAARKALQEFQPLAPARIVPALAEGLKAVRAARQALPRLNATENARAEADFLLAIKERDFTAALLRAAGVIVDPLAEEDTAVPGGVFGVNVRLFLTDPSLATLVSTAVKAPAGWTVSQTPVREVREEGFRPRERPSATARYEVRVPAAAAPTQPYFLTQPREGDRYVWPQGSPKALPFDPPALTGEATLSIAGVDVVATQPVDYRFADPIRGELRRAPAVVPPVTVGVDASLLIVPLGATPQQRRIVVRASSASSAPVAGTLSLRVPTGWTATPPEAPLALKARGEQTSAVFTVTAPAARTAGSYAIEAEARIGAATFSRDLQLVSYPHIQPHRLYSPARARVEVLSLDVAAVRLGYVMGSGDQVPEAIRRMGIDVTMLDEEALATGDLSRFDTIVVGIRASETRPDFVANNGRLLQWVEQGGTLIVQYQQREYFDRGLTPYPAAQMNNSRVTDEAAPIRILAPGHPAFTFPNQITAADFEGWVQERNLYAFTSFDRQRYTPLLETADPGEPAQQGGEVYAELGRGRYVYTAYSWFRQLPAGVPGAYRQFANLISLSRAPR